IADQLVARPFADDGARDVADVVLVEAEHRAEAGGGERLARAREPVAVQAPEVDALLEVDLRDAGRLERPAPAVAGVEVGFVDRNEAGLLAFLRHARIPIEGWSAIIVCDSRFRRGQHALPDRRLPRGFRRTVLPRAALGLRGEEQHGARRLQRPAGPKRLPAHRAPSARPLDRLRGPPWRQVD